MDQEKNYCGPKSLFIGEDKEYHSIVDFSETLNADQCNVEISPSNGEDGESSFAEKHFYPSADCVIVNPSIARIVRDDLSRSVGSGSRGARNARSLRLHKKDLDELKGKPSLLRSGSAPYLFKTLSVSDLTSEVYVNKNIEGITTSFFSLKPPRVVVHPGATPPPTYSSLTKYRLTDIPPSYQIVTGLALNVKIDREENVGKTNPRDDSCSVIGKQNKILIIIIIVIILISTLTLIIAETFRSTR